MGGLRVVVAEDDFLVRQALVSLVEDQPDWELAAICQDFDELMSAVEREAPDVVVTDIRMPPTRTDEGIRAAIAVRVLHPRTGVVVLSHYADPSYVTSLLQGGTEGRGYLLKQHLAAPDQFRDAVRTVASGGSYVDAEVVRVWAAGQGAQGASRLSDLTPRERQVLAAMATGRTNAGIADELVITERAVQKHINAIFTKLSISDDPGRHGRVTAVLTYLQESRPEPTSGDAWHPSGRGGGRR